MRQTLVKELQMRKLITDEINAKSSVIRAYPCPSYIAKKTGQSRQLVAKMYAENGIVYNSEMGVWVKNALKENTDAQV